MYGTKMAEKRTKMPRFGQRYFFGGNFF